MMDTEYVFEYIPFGRSTLQTKTNIKVYKYRLKLNCVRDGDRAR